MIGLSPGPGCTELWILLLFALPVITGCADSLSPEARPPAPRLVRFQDDPFLERGIRPDPDAPSPDDPAGGAIIVEWERPGPPELFGVRPGGYRVYRSERIDAAGIATDFELVGVVPASLSNIDTFFSDRTVRQNVGYAYYVTMYGADPAGSESENSDTARFTLTERPVPLSPGGSIEPGGDGPLRFRFSPATASGYVAIELEEISLDNEQLVLRHLWQERGMAGFDEPSLPYSGDPLRPGHRYRWRVEKIFPQGQPIGNASRWVTFLVQ